LKPLHLIAFCAAMLAGLHGCASINTDRAAMRPPSQAISRDTPSQLQMLAHKPDPATPAESSFVLLDSGLDALAARLWLAQKAEKTLDVQYYIFHGDKTGALVAQALMEAAERGVRVRILLDDIYTHRHEADIMALYSHPNIEVRLFNPFHFRGGNPLLQLGQYLRDERVNRRMHNKLFAADNQFAITGGRNVGDEYFVAHDDFSFVDLDVLASGPVVGELSRSFDAYWASEAVIPARALPGYKLARHRLPALKVALQNKKDELEQTDYGRELQSVRFEQRLLSGELPAYLATARVVADPPEKVEGNTPASQLLVGQLSGLGTDTRQEVIVVSPYFVPGKMGVGWMGYMRARGIRVRVLTNSLAASDVPVVHAGYAKYRKALLELGVELYELKPLPNASPRKTRIIGSGSSRSSLHTKSLVFDREKVFIGSFNFDPRSAWLNTELGLVIESREIAGKVAEMAERAMGPDFSHQLSLKNSGDKTAIVWRSRTDRREFVTDTEPNTSWWKRRWVDFLTLLPIESHL
jgi:putative cardiolipin synthase